MDSIRHVGSSVSASYFSIDGGSTNVLGFQVAPTSFTISSGQTFSGTTIIYPGDAQYVESGHAGRRPVPRRRA
jgi:hypothetical protein